MWKSEQLHKNGGSWEGESSDTAPDQMAIRPTQEAEAEKLQ
jgi:hypothetical protein